MTLRTLWRVAAIALVLSAISVQKAVGQCEDLTGLRKRLCQATQVGRGAISGGTDAILGPIAAELLDPMRQPITTSFANARRGPTLPESFTPAPFQSFRILGRTQNGAFLLRPGAYEGTFESYCLHAGTRGPGRGDGYCPAPVLGPAANTIRAILKESLFHPEVSQQSIQYLLWGILARLDYQHMPAPMQRTAATLLPQESLEQLKGGPLSRLPDNMRQPLERMLQQRIASLAIPLQRNLLAESNIRQQAAAAAPYEILERTAVLAGLQQELSTAPISRGTWIQHPQGYYVRYLPESYSRTKIQVFVPETAALPRAQAAVFIHAAYTPPDTSFSSVFDPTEEIATPANTGAQRLAQTARLADVGACPDVYTSVAAGNTLMPRPATLADLPKPDFWNLFWTVINRSPVGVLIAEIFTPSEIAKDDLENALVQCPPVARTKTRAAEECPPTMPTVSFYYSRTPAIAAHIQAAQIENPSWKILTKSTEESATDSRRRAACSGIVALPGSNLSCDEYPFASTLQGGEGASVRLVPLSEQYSQGGTLRNFYAGKPDGTLFCVDVK